jgi:E3 ubiquitin-protein ligase BRE1
MRLEARTVAAPSLDAVKMEDRKRPIADDSAPPAKRQALTVNGARSHPDADLPWKDDIEVRPPITTARIARTPRTHRLIREIE